MKTTRDNITLNIRDCSDGISKAISEACEVSEYLAAGVIGPSFCCSGPGAGWQANCGPNDYAARALSDEYGAAGYVDVDDGRLATLDDDGEVEWSEGSVVELTAPTADEIDDDRDAAVMMVEALDNGHCIAGQGDWGEARALVKVSESEALERWDMEIVNDSVIYRDDGTRKWYLNHRVDLIGLRALMGSDDDDISGNAYSHWCATHTHTHEGEYETRQDAIAAAEVAA